MRRHDAPLCCTRLCRLSSHTASVKCPISVWRQASRTIFSPIQHSFPPHTHKQAAATCVQFATVFVSVRVLRPTSYTFLLQILSLCMAVAAASALQQPLRQWRYGSIARSGRYGVRNGRPTVVVRHWAHVVERQSAHQHHKLARRCLFKDTCSTCA